MWNHALRSFITRIGSSVLSNSKTMLSKQFCHSPPNGMTPDSCPSSVHHSKPTSEQRNTAPSSKTNERAAEHRAIVEDRQSNSGTPGHRRRPTNKLQNTAPTAKADERAADHHAIVDSSKAPPDYCLSSIFEPRTSSVNVFGTHGSKPSSTDKFEIAR